MPRRFNRPLSLDAPLVGLRYEHLADRLPETRLRARTSSRNGRPCAINSILVDESSRDPLPCLALLLAWRASVPVTPRIDQRQLCTSCDAGHLGRRAPGAGIGDNSTASATTAPPSPLAADAMARHNVRIDRPLDRVPPDLLYLLNTDASPAPVGANEVVADGAGQTVVLSSARVESLEQKGPSRVALWGRSRYDVGTL